jgi:hypothetical protein
MNTHDDAPKRRRRNAGLKAAETKGLEERKREALMAAWTRKNGKNDALNPYSSKIGADRDRTIPFTPGGRVAYQRKDPTLKGLIIAEPWVSMIMAGRKLGDALARHQAAGPHRAYQEGLKDPSPIWSARY